MNSNGRQPVLEQYGSFYGAEHFAVTFTAGIAGDDAKRVTQPGWDKTLPLADAGFGAGLVGSRGLTRNIAVVLRPSNLIVLECDSEDDLARIQSLNLPMTLTVRSSEPYKRHFYFRPPPTLEALPYVAFRFESGKLTADSGRYFLAPPSIHPSGTIYAFLPELGPDDVDIAELPEQTYRDLSQQAQRESSDQRDRIEIDPDAKIRAGNRRDLIFRYACMLRRWGLTRHEISQQCHAFNETRCDPPVDRNLVEVQVDGAMKKRGDQELQIEETPLEASQPAPSIVTLYHFIHEHEETPEAVIGDPEETLLPAGGLLILGGEGGSSKTTLTLDAIAHICSGTDWLGFPTHKPVRALIIENEGPRAHFRNKLRAKTESWNGDDFQHNVYVWEEPWATFNFSRPNDRENLIEFAEDRNIDLVIADPLDSLGIAGAGTPEDTRRFIDYLRDCGLHNPLKPLAFWLLHHFNKSLGRSVVQQLSGSWGGHPDTIIGLELGDGQTTKLTWGKLRHATPPKDKTVVLAWDTETRGFTPLDKPPPVDVTELRQKVLSYVQAHPGESQSAVEDAVGGGRKAAREALEWLSSDEGSHLLANGPGRVKHGKYFYPSNHAALLTPNDRGVIAGVTLFDLPGLGDHANPPSPLKGGKAWRDPPDGHPDPDQDEAERLAELYDPAYDETENPPA